MFVSKRRVKKKDYFYLEDRVLGKRISFFLGTKKDARATISGAFDSLVTKTIVENFKFTKKKFKINHFSLNELLVLEKLRVDYALLKYFFLKEFVSLKEDEFVRYAQGSTSIEGNSLTLQEASLVLNQGLSVTGKTIGEIREVENMLFTVRETKKIRGLNEKNIKRIHSAVMRGFNEKGPGEYRSGPVFIVGSLTKPPMALLVPKKMANLINWLNKNESVLHPVGVASEFHARFEGIHPFLDGNGRVGRELLNFLLQKSGYPRVIINQKNRGSYLVLLERVQSTKKYANFSKFVYLCLEERGKEISNLLEENKSLIIKKLLKKVG